MANLELSAISRQLLSLANPDLPLVQREQLTQIFQQLFADLAAGHSCSRVELLTEKLALNPAQIQDLLQLSGLVTLYSSVPLNLQATPLSYLALASGD